MSATPPAKTRRFLLSVGVAYAAMMVASFMFMPRTTHAADFRLGLTCGVVVMSFVLVLARRRQARKGAPR